MVQFVNVRELKNQASAVLRRARRGDIVVTTRGRPTAVLHAVAGGDLDDYLLAHSPKFQKTVQAAFRDYRRRGGVSLDALIHETERELARLRR
jgi:prevent-host-death family protein